MPDSDVDVGKVKPGLAVAFHLQDSEAPMFLSHRRDHGRLLSPKSAIV